MKEEKADPHSSKRNPESSNSYLKFSGIAFEVAAFNLLIVWGGYELSARFTPKYHLILIGAVLFSVAGTIYYLFKRLNN